MTIKLGIVGTGTRGVDCFGQLFRRHPEVTVVALCDPNPVRVKAASEILGGRHELYQDVPSMLEKEELDAVVVTSPDYCHCGNALDVLARGVNVLIDKPLAIRADDCRAIIEASRRHNRIAMMGFNLRHNPTLARLKQIVDAGTLGRVFLIENREFYKDGRTYMSRWNRRAEKSGGLWIHKGAHDFDTFAWLFGFPRPLTVSASASVNVYNLQNLPFEVEDGIQVGPTCHECAYKGSCPDYYEFPLGKMWGDEAASVDGYQKDLCMYLSDKNVHDNGIAVVEYENNLRASHFECFVTSQTGRSYTVVGTHGQAEANLRDRVIIVRSRWNEETTTIQLPESKGGHSGADPHLVDAFVDVVTGRRPNTSTLEHGLFATAVGQAAEIASRERRMVHMDELLG